MSFCFIKFPQAGFRQSHAALLALLGATNLMVRKIWSDKNTIDTVFLGLSDKNVLYTNPHCQTKCAKTTCGTMAQNRIDTFPPDRFADSKQSGYFITYTCSAEVGLIFFNLTNSNDTGVCKGLLQ